MILLLALFIYLFYKTRTYQKSSYYKITRNRYLKVCRNAGLKGEYLIFQKLQQYEAQGARFLFNCYLPKDDGTTTEIDVLMIHPTGLYVVESKNYKGWIFGSEKARFWTQTLPKGRGCSHKEHFYNPIMQNREHIKWLKSFLGDEALPCHSIIVFSDSCTLKKIDLHSPAAIVINRRNLKASVGQVEAVFPHYLTKSDVDRIYERMYPWSKLSDAEKQQHIRNIRKRMRKQDPQALRSKNGRQTATYNHSQTATYNHKSIG